MPSFSEPRAPIQGVAPVHTGLEVQKSGVDHKVRVGTIDNVTSFQLNCYFDGLVWQRDDTAKPASLLMLNQTTGDFQYRYAAAGANPITWGTPFKVDLNGNIRTTGNLGVGNSANATILGSVTKRIQVYDQNGSSLGYIPVYSTIT